MEIVYSQGLQNICYSQGAGIAVQRLATGWATEGSEFESL
jgi:hypothetical protein